MFFDIFPEISVHFVMTTFKETLLLAHFSVLGEEDEVEALITQGLAYWLVPWTPSSHDPAITSILPSSI